MIRRPPRSTLFPYPPLSRSAGANEVAADAAHPFEPRRAALRQRGREPCHVGRNRFLGRSEEHMSELQSQSNLVCRLLLEKKKTNIDIERRQSQAAIPIQLA